MTLIFILVTCARTAPRHLQSRDLKPQLLFVFQSEIYFFIFCCVKTCTRRVFTRRFRRVYYARVRRVVVQSAETRDPIRLRYRLSSTVL